MKSKWIGVSDLPEKLQDERVLIAYKERWFGVAEGESGVRNHEERMVSVGEITGGGGESGLCAILDTGEEIDESDILGWQRLPVAPVEVPDGN